jgi:DNA-binding transcriptional regulator LsrR (DeoR family)
MLPVNDETRAAIHRLYFVERRRLDSIAAELRLRRAAVRRALVIDGGAVRPPVHGPYHKENDS